VTSTTASTIVAADAAVAIHTYPTIATTSAISL